MQIITIVKYTILISSFLVYAYYRRIHRMCIYYKSKCNDNDEKYYKYSLYIMLIIIIIILSDSNLLNQENSTVKY